ncbi:hypothetical protein CLV47_10586 [Antricoccus suffuscus]|uniref:Uncharacterized protein n=1 Tax=Antricoccus suffuscus TaxID=1629062 RepID=A0A2T1A1Q5_9ACTN|nr:hypothetical protein [Antricoccus suffuscus]PRZ42464.1 hypothetical protein CLV47_10586 [Antricoccus suffuscus]
MLSLTAAAVALLCGCSITLDGRGSTRHTFTPPTGPDDVVVQVVTAGGYAPLSSYLRTTASYTLLGDGTLIVADGDYGDALVSLEMATIGTAQISDIVKNADNAGILGPESDYDQPNVTDMPSTSVAVNVDDTSYSQSAYALYFDEHDDDLSGPAQKRRAQLRDFIDHIDELATDTVDYAPDAIVIYRLPADEGSGSEPVKPWPIATAPPASNGSPTCIVVDGDEANILAAAAQDADADDLWQVGTETPTTFAMRPLLPGDKGCEK